MSASPTLAPSRPPLEGRRASARAFYALCSRDAWVVVRHELAGFLAQSLLQPVFFLFVFGRVLPEIGAAGGGYGDQLLPGIVGLTLVLTALQNTALPLVIEFSFTKEIEDRLLAPLPAWLVGVQKIVFAAGRGIVAAVLVLPLAAVILPDGVNLTDVNVLGLVALLFFGGIAGAAVGLVLGTAVPPNRINVVFAVVLTPLTFTGATFYPWAGLDAMPVFQAVSLLNPLTFVSEGMRAALTDLPHMGVEWVVLGVGVATVLFSALGIRGFVRRAVD
ncbi:MAG: ABC transporter permease [Solirubrobacteraceae bacterium]|nr:ABC transporter permease [Solirubrobacteraceae bacterium]